MQCKQKQSGASLIAAIFLITGLAVLGGLLARTMSVASEATVADLFAAQALYAAEAGVDQAVHRILRGDPPSGAPSPLSPPAAPLPEVVTDRAWFYVYADVAQNGDRELWTIVSTGLAGTDAANPMAQRRVQVLFVK